MDSLDFLEIEHRPIEFSKTFSLPFADQKNAPAVSDLEFTDTTNWQKGVAACVGSFLTNLVVTPFDVVKTRLQFQSLNDSSRLKVANRSSALCEGGHMCPGISRSLFFNEWPVPFSQVASSLSNAEPVNPAIRFTGTLDAFSKIAKNEGVSKLWRGLSPTLVQSFPSTVIYYVGYDILRDSLSKVFPDSKIKAYSPLIAGAFARSTVISPLELFRTRLQSADSSQTFKEVASGVLNMVRSQGLKSLWRGLTPTLWRDVPFSAIYWMGYETIKTNLIDNCGSRLSHFGVSFVSGALSGSVAAIITTPFDVLKTRHQIQDQSNTLQKNKGTFRIIFKIIQQEGIKELFSGLTARVAKVAPACAIMVSSYEIGKIFGLVCLTLTCMGILFDIIVYIKTSIQHKELSEI